MQEMQIQVKGRSVTELLLPGWLHTAERESRSLWCCQITHAPQKRESWESSRGNVLSRDWLASRIHSSPSSFRWTAQPGSLAPLQHPIFCGSAGGIINNWCLKAKDNQVGCFGTHSDSMLQTPWESLFLRQLPHLFSNNSVLQCLWDKTCWLSNSFYSLQVHRHLWCSNAITTPGALTCPGIVNSTDYFLLLFFPRLLLSAEVCPSFCMAAYRSNQEKKLASGQVFEDLHCSKSWNLAEQTPLHAVFSHLLCTKVRKSTSFSRFYH